jgi:AraC-like DNA-binding protein
MVPLSRDRRPVSFFRGGDMIRVRSLSEGYPEGGALARHAHRWDQLAVVTGSAVTVETEAAYFVQPTRRGFWLPAGVPHTLRCARPFSLHSLYFEPGRIDLGHAPAVVALSDLAHELVLFLCAAPGESERGVEHEHAGDLLAVLLARAAHEPLRLARPRDPRAHRLADFLLAHRADRRPLEILAAEVGGASLRTLERLFLAETGLTLAAWRRQSRLLSSLYLLAEGETVGDVANAVGYESAAAFSTAFRRSFGRAPLRPRSPGVPAS